MNNFLVLSDDVFQKNTNKTYVELNSCRWIELDTCGPLYGQFVENIVDKDKTEKGLLRKSEK